MRKRVHIQPIILINLDKYVHLYVKLKGKRMFMIFVDLAKLYIRVITAPTAIIHAPEG